MNGHIVWGFIITALGPLIGGFLIHHGNGIASKASLESQNESRSKEADERIQPILRDLQTLKGMPPAELSFDAVAKVEGEVKSWANDFVKDGYALKKAYETTSNQKRNQATADKAKIVEYFNFLITTMRTAIDAYNEILEVKIKYNLPAASTDNLIANTNNYVGEIEFSPNIRWAMSPVSADGNEQQSKFVLRLVSNANSTLPHGDKGQSYFQILFLDNATKFLISKDGDFQAAFPETSIRMKEEQFESKIKELVKKSLDWQLLSILEST
jgi:hypothetical protein